jgi:hypothetical protein
MKISLQAALASCLDRLACLIFVREDCRSLRARGLGFSPGGTCISPLRYSTDTLPWGGQSWQQDLLESGSPPKKRAS